MKAIEAVNIFLQSQEARGLSKETIRWYRGILRSFMTRFTKLPKMPTEIEVFLSKCKTGDERKHGYYRTLRCFYRFLHRRYRIPNPMELVDPPRRTHKEPHWLTPEEINQLLSYPHPPKIKAILLFLIDTGARVGEAASLSINNLIECPWGYAAIIKGKTGVRHVPISYETYHALMVNLPFGYTKYRLRRKISQAFREAGIKGSGITLRHSFGTLWQGDELILQRIMGHRNLSTTQNYRHLRIKALLEQHARYSPLKMVMGRTREMFAQV